ncbi:MAG: GDSL-type esterase/lipase family protein [Bacteroidota bacterium]
MNKVSFIFFILSLASCSPVIIEGIAKEANYLSPLKKELVKEWPNNHTINIVFHGHSVPAGYFKTPVVNTIDAYPFLVLKRLKERYPHAVINVINTAIGGENSQQGAKRFKTEVLTHQPDLIFIDYALNDRRIGLEVSCQAWDEMIKKALRKNVKVILLTPSPDQRVDLLAADNELKQHRNQIEKLARINGIGFVDSYRLFKEKVEAGEDVSIYMSQVNHPNKKGHQLIADEIFKYFE